MELAGILLITLLIICSYWLGYRRGFNACKVCLPLILRQQSLESGRCQLCKIQIAERILQSTSD